MSLDNLAQMESLAYLNVQRTRLNLPGEVIEGVRMKSSDSPV
jgi:hypothetical protein